MAELEIFFGNIAKTVDCVLDNLLPAADSNPQSLHEAMRWSIFAGGKRFRPALVFAAGRIFSAADESLKRTAAAVEMLHTYSLIHDDLPAMDDDDLRRGRETCHKRFGEATAILAGDALQALAFQAVSEDENLSAGIRLLLVEKLARAAARMVNGQQLDLEAEGKRSTIDEIRAIHEGKTAALVRFSAMAGAIIAEASEDETKAIAEYGSHLGLLFQITDDLLDVTQTSETLGKTAGKDIANGKATYPGIYGVEESERQARNVYAEAINCLDEIKRPTEILREIADFILSRKA